MVYHPSRCDVATNSGRKNARRLCFYREDDIILSLVREVYRYSLYVSDLICSGAGNTGADLFIAKNLWFVYNMFNKVADTIAYTYPFPAKVINKK